VKITISINPQKVVKTLVFMVCALLSANMIGQIAKYFLGYEHLFGFVERTYFQANLSIPGWYSSVTYFICALLIAVISIGKQRSGDRYVWQWRGLGILFLFISMDKISSFHELLYIPSRIPFVVAFLILYMRFFMGLPRKTKLLFAIGTTFYLVAAFVIDFIGVEILQVSSESFIYAMFQTGNQLFKMLGTITFIYALLSYLHDHAGNVHIMIEEV
jgi:hypothetical protein